ncbi:neuropeptide FF receptor 1 like 1 isoform X1 [Danio rerio]|uniref:Neuropeptide FF receptor 1 n=1 Tax=Danio rerio TaxID=7955 RepID=D2Y177_DANRE|nr:neuropeptide FF receptor 1 like 1 [Danio rerio]XP_009303884.1 neuropeptide FF receptor 1 like 1 isoform X1 [Danio rerio]ADB43133.1 neuropeptide GnIHR1 [Danio rerio]|eukprot:NP_001165167.1 neuropeptide FF receptor 1 like 1 [Danio rerio]
MDTMTLNHSAANLSWQNCTLLPYYIHSAGMAVSYILSYLLVLLLCVVGNGLVCLVVIRNRNMRSVTNLFILNLAVSDLLVGIFCVPTTLIDSLISGWPFSQITCTMSNLVQGMSVSASVFTLVAIAVDRFTGIVYPFHHRLRPVTALFAIVFIWLLAFAIIFPSAATLTVIHLDDMYMVQNDQIYPLFVCFEDWPRADMRRVYTTVIFVHVYLAPLGLISIMYGCIAAKLSSNLQENRLRSRRRMKVIKMLIMVAVLFMVSWLPLWTLMLLTDYQDLDRQQIDFLSSYLFPVAHWLAFFNSGVNPIIYGFFNENFRRGFQAAVACGFCSSVASEMRHTHFVLPPPNKVSDGSRGVTSGRKERCFPVIPHGAAHGIQGILLEDMNGTVASHRVLGAWME